MTLPAGSRYFGWKHWFDRLMVVVLLLPALAILAVLAALVLVTSGRPVFFGQMRVGRGGKLFTMYKLRTMGRGAESKSGAVWCAPNDSRVTWFGRFLRVTHLDELPQILNVLGGQMNLIGPRPERPKMVRQLAREIPGYVGRLAVLPGATGLAQVTFASDTCVADVRRKLELDMQYIRTAGPLMDLRILLHTLPHLMPRRPNFAMRGVALDTSREGTARERWLPFTPHLRRRFESPTNDTPRLEPALEKSA